jgi:hypothetical protein
VWSSGRDTALIEAGMATIRPWRVHMIAVFVIADSMS